MPPRSMLQVDVDVDPEPALIMAGFFKAAATFTGGFKEPLEDAIKHAVIPAINHQFDVGGDPPWQPLSNATIERRERRGTGSKILEETGNLRNVATSMSPWTIRDNEAFMLGSNLGTAYYGTYHEVGTKWMPARPWATLTTQEEEAIEQVFAAHTIGRILKFTLVTTLVGGVLGGTIAGLGGLLRSIIK